MMRFTAIALLCISATTCLGVARAQDPSDPPETVKEISLPNYLGRWYQVYANRYWFSRFPDHVCSTADYGLNINGTVSVENNARLNSPSSPNATSIRGYAYIDNPAEPGQLLVVFPNPGPPGEYWIIKLGPLEETFPSVPQYQYAVVTNSERVSLFVQARNPEEYYARFDDEVQAFLKEEGFTKFYNAPKASPQGPDCIYAGESSETNAVHSGVVEPTDLDRNDKNSGHKLYAGISQKTLIVLAIISALFLGYRHNYFAVN